MKDSEGKRWRRAGMRIERNRWIKALEEIVKANPDLQKLSAILVLEILKDSLEEYVEES